MNLLNTNQVKELTPTEERICQFLMLITFKKTKKTPIHGAVLGQKWNYVEGQYQGNYYFEKQEFPTEYIIFVGNDDIAVRFWLTESELHIYSLEVNEKLRNNGVGSLMLKAFKSIGEDLNLKVTLRAEPIEFNATMNKVVGKQYGPRFYKKWKGAIDRRMDKLINFYEKNGFTRTEDIGVYFEWNPIK
jgi:GNAT superfamily N-acetyltransferase